MQRDKAGGETETGSGEEAAAGMGPFGPVPEWGMPEDSGCAEGDEANAGI